MHDYRYCIHFLYSIIVLLVLYGTGVRFPRASAQNHALHSCMQHSGTGTPVCIKQVDWFLPIQEVSMTGSLQTFLDTGRAGYKGTEANHATEGQSRSYCTRRVMWN